MPKITALPLLERSTHLFNPNRTREQISEDEPQSQRNEIARKYNKNNGS